MKALALVWFGLAAFSLGISQVGGVFKYAFYFSAFCFLLSIFSYRIAKAASKNSLPPGAGPKIEPPLQGKIDSELEKNLSLREKRKLHRGKVEEKVDRCLLDLLAVLKQAISTHTLGVFLPHGEGKLHLRAWITEGESIMPKVEIRQGQGLVGLLLKKEVNRILESSLSTESTNLHYYSIDEKIKSIAGVPILVEGTRRGAVVADSLEENAFGPATILLLQNFAAAIGELLHSSYMGYELRYQRDQLHALSSYQRKFLENMSEAEIVAYVQDYVTESLDAERFILAGRADGRSDEARVLFCTGIDQSYFKDFGFKVSENGLTRLVFEKEQVVSRSFKKGEVIPRFSPRERNHENFKCIFAYPMSTDKGVTHLLMMESTRREQFGDHEKELLSTIAKAAAFAISKARIYEEKENMSKRDGLTGLLNRRAFQDQYKSAILQAGRENQPLSILMLDIDFFKKVNDNHGHPVGDMVLKAVGQIIQNILRSGRDIVARFGGEEFVGILSDTTPEKAFEIAERIRHSVQAQEFDLGGGKRLRVTLSIGGASLPQDSKEGKELLDKADKALYRAKNEGRNKVIFFSGMKSSVPMETP